MSELKGLTRKWAALLWCVAALVCAIAHGVSAIEVWTPDTGEVELEALPRDTPELRRQHALALVGAGQWAGGVAELRQLIQAEPNADWVERARLSIARGLIIGDRYRGAFDELGGLKAVTKDPEVREEAGALQHITARRAVDYDVRMGIGLYDALVDMAETSERAAATQKELADALFGAEYYLEAEDEYWEFIDLHPHSELAPYCYYRVAECQLAVARWLGLGLEHIEGAEQSFSDFIDAFPAHTYAAEAGEKLAETRRDQAAVYADVARFYIRAEKKPWAAVNYLEHICEQFPDTTEARWAERELVRIQEESLSPLRGRTRQMELPGVGVAQPME